ncbi:hypothetical protein OS493_040049 [Desmophyllum pertusum]|uniref:Uncharacterized protein n=1 Tax=Desmophyllum pertusum TaxID=174260 RepID=A0A9X0D747_9CNID|nr:hypothetical protein OS493_040049 [Desmophyllum pertusum]
MEMEVGAEAGDAENRCPIFKYRKLNTEQHWEMIHIISSFTSFGVINDKRTLWTEISQQPYHIALNITLSSLKIDSKKTPVEFFGVPINDKTLLEAILILFWEFGKRFVDSETYEDHHNGLASGKSQAYQGVSLREGSGQQTSRNKERRALNCDEQVGTLVEKPGEGAELHERETIYQRTKIMMYRNVAIRLCKHGGNNPP